jgi:uncharacterized RmlC-like cupin family protein
MRSLMRSLAIVITLPVLAAFATQPSRAQEKPADAEIITIHPTATSDTKQGLPVFVGISGKNAGTKHISMNKVVIPAGKSAKAHLHKGYESVIYIIKGRVKTLYGEGLKKSVINEAGDFLYIPADLPHKPINLSDTEEAVAIVARTDPNEQESVEQIAEPQDAGAGAEKK